MKQPKNINGIRVVIVGANFGGLAAAKKLSKKFQVTVVDPEPFFEFFPNIHELVSQVKKTQHLRLSKRKIVEAAGHRFLMDDVRDWRPDRNRILTRSGITLNYDYAVCAVGGTTNYFGVPGAKKNAFNFKSVDDCKIIGDTLTRLVKTQPEVSLVIVGGGIEGVEALGEVLRHYSRRAGIRIHLIDGQSRVLSFGSPGLHDEVIERCRTAPVAFHLGTSVKRVTLKQVELSSGRKIPADMVIWTGGVGPRKELFDWGLTPDAGKWVPVNNWLQSEAFPNIFVAGDAAGLEKPLGKQAYYAMDMGEHAALNIHLLANQRPLKAFRPSAKPMLITFGHLTTFLLTDAFTLSGPALTFAKEAVYQAVMAQFDHGWKPERSARIVLRLAAGMKARVLPFLSAPHELFRLGSLRLIR